MSTPKIDLHHRSPLILSILLAISFSLSTSTYAQVQPGDPATIAQWTILVYLDGDNDLESDGVDSFLWMSQVGATDEVKILVQFDRISLPIVDDTRYGDWTGAKRFYVTQGMTPSPSNALEDLGEVNMGSAQTLIDFVRWGMTNYPAQNYAVVLWDHGRGWKFNSSPQIFSVDLLTDWTSGGDGFTMRELLDSFSAVTDEGAHPVDLIGFDACLMAMIEVDNQILPYGLVRVGSEETIPREAWPYHEFLSSLVANPSMTPGELGQEIVQKYYDYYTSYTLSAVYLDNSYTTLNASVNAFAQALIGGLNSYRSQISNSRSDTLHFNLFVPLADYSFVDLYDFAFQISQRVTDDAINLAASNVMDAIHAVVLHERHGLLWNGAHGISIYFPVSAGEYDVRYDGVFNWLTFTGRNQWGEWLREYFSLPGWSSIISMPVIANR